MKKQKILGLILAIVMTGILPMAMTVSAADMKFDDVRSSDWFYPYVKRLYEGGMTSGVSAASYAPEKSVTIAEVSAFITRYLGIEEDASVLAEQMKLKNIQGAQLWYAGYIQLMLRAGVIQPSALGISPLTDGFFPINADTALSLERPALRIEVIDMIARSFELDNSAVRSRILPQGVGGLGHELICGGGYDESSLSRQKDYIGDIASIPEDKLNSVLKLMYNGIINGDDKGKINPQNPISRAEVAKIIAATANFDLRTRRETRAVSAGLEVTANDFVTSPRTGNTVLSSQKCEAILRQAASGVKAAASGTSSTKLEFSLDNIVPEGYIIQVIAYIKSGARYIEFSNRISPDTSGVMYPQTRSSDPTASDLMIVYVLRSAERGSEIQATLSCMIDDKCNISYVYEW